MDLSVVIPTLNEEGYLGKTLECLRKQSMSDFEIVVVDGNSTDGTRDLAKQYTDRVFILKKRGVGLARNYGVSKSRGKLLVMTDADTTFPSTWLERIAHNMRERSLGMLYGPVHYTKDVTLPARVWTDFFWLVHPLTWKSSPFVMNPNLAFTREGFKKIGGYRTDIHFMDDYDIGIRSSQKLPFFYDSGNPVVFSARRYRTLQSYLKDVPKVIRGMFEYHATGSASGHYTAIR